ncbi:MAG: serine/threonine protein kinase [Myxococcales bacterium]|nr:serine/threonine protein kinase [Myxococcales bacterium]
MGRRAAWALLKGRAIMTLADTLSGTDESSAVRSLRFPSDHPVHGAALLLGTRRLFAGRFLLKRTLGKGGMGVVYLAEDTMAGTEVALKIFAPRYRVSRDHIERAIRPEVILARKVSHPHVCRVYDMGRASSEVFLTMEYVNGRTLRQIIDGGGVSARRTDRYLRHILEALSAIHRAGVVHRDLKPSNVMVTRHNRVVVLDFGLASDARDDGHVGIPVGTIRYAAPEQLEGRRASVQSDIFSFGLIAEEMLALAYPQGIPAALKDFLSKCQSRDPKGRFPSADAAHRALVRAESKRRMLSEIRRVFAALFTLSG